MTSTLLILQFVLAVLIVIVVLLQKSSSIGLGAYSGSNDSLFGAKGPANFLSKITVGLGVAFVINTLVLGFMYNEERKKSVFDNVKIETLNPINSVPATNEVPATPIAPEAPTTQNIPAKTESSNQAPITVEQTESQTEQTTNKDVKPDEATTSQEAQQSSEDTVIPETSTTKVNEETK